MSGDTTAHLGPYGIYTQHVAVVDAPRVDNSKHGAAVARVHVDSPSIKATWQGLAVGELAPLPTAAEPNKHIHLDLSSGLAGTEQVQLVTHARWLDGHEEETTTNLSITYVNRDTGPDVATRPPMSEHDKDRQNDLLTQAVLIDGVIYSILDAGNNLAIDAIAETRHAKSAAWLDILLGAASVALAGGAGLAAYKIASALEVGKVTEKFVVDGCKELIKSAYKGALGAVSFSVADEKDLLRTFKRLLYEGRVAGRARFAAAWPGFAESLRALPLDELARFNQHALDRNDDSTIAQVSTKTMIAWTNFLARAEYGGMPARDPWNPEGGPGHALPGAPPADHEEDAPTRDNNVNPENGELWVRDGMMMHPIGGTTFHGMLHVPVIAYLDGRARLVERWGMQLNGISDAVRKQFRAMGKVRALPVNKLITLMSTHDAEDVKGTLVITADGYVRSGDVTAYNFPPGYDVDTFLTGIAESVQSMSLEDLGGE